MTRTPGLMVPLLGLSLGLAVSLPEAVATDCGSEHLVFPPVARTRWLAPRVRTPGPLDSLYGTVRRFLSVVQLNPFPSGECPLPQRALQALGPKLAPVHILSKSTCRLRFLTLHSLLLPYFLRFHKQLPSLLV